MSATASGFATITAHGVVASRTEATSRDFELPRGQRIGGVVTDATGNGIADATVSAACLDTTTRSHFDVRTDPSGRFEFDGLVDASFRLDAFANGFQQTMLQPVRAGESDQRIVLEKHGGARLRVRAPNGRAVTQYQLSVLRHFPQSGHAGQLPKVSNLSVRPRDLGPGGAFESTGLPPGEYVFEVEPASGASAKTRSEVFRVGPAGDGSPLSLIHI